MNEPLAWVLASIAGTAIGAIFFGGLWWTIRRAASASQPARWLFGSLLVRMAIALAGFFYVSGGHWQRWLACLVGFVAARAAVTWLTRRSSPEAGHAP